MSHMDAGQDAEEFAEPTFDRCINVVTQQAPICLVVSSNAEWSSTTMGSFFWFLNSLFLAAGRAAEEFAKPMFDRCINIVTQQLAGRVAVANGQHVEPEPEREFIICSLDVISGRTSNGDSCSWI